MHTARRLFPAAAHLQAANSLTSLVVLLGFLAIALSARSHFAWAAIALAVAAGVDRADGMVARRLRQSSAMGAELDSLADAVSFCVAPAFLAYLTWPRPAVLAAAAAFVVCGVWRLAYFNVTGLDETPRGPSYTGVPTTIAASWLVVVLSALAAARVEPPSWVPPVLLALLALAMISAAPYPKNAWPTRALYLALPLVIVVHLARLAG